MCLLQIESLSVTFHGHDLIVDSELELNYGRFDNLAYLTVILHMEPVLDAIFSVPYFVFQTIWIAWFKWMWEINTPNCNRLPRASNSRTHGYISPH